METFHKRVTEICVEQPCYHLPARIIIFYLTSGLCGQLGFVNISVLYAILLPTDYFSLTPVSYTLTSVRYITSSLLLYTYLALN